MARSADIDGAGQDREARGNANDVELVAGLFYEQFGATGFRRWKEYAVGSAGNIFLGAKNTDVGFNFVVIGSDVLVSDGPIIAQTIARAGSKVDGRKTERDAAPVIGAATNDARTKPLEVRAWRGSIGLAVDDPCAVGRKKFAKIFARVTANARATMRQFVRPHQHFEIFLGVYRRPGFQQDNIQATFGENFGGHAAACAGAHDTYVIGFWRTNNLRHPLKFTFFHLRDGKVASPSGEGHVRKRRIDASGRNHAGTVSEKKIFYVMGLIVFVQDGGLGVLAHACGTHLVNGQARSVIFDERTNVSGARGGEHLGGLDRHVSQQGFLVVTKGAMNF